MKKVDFLVVILLNASFYITFSLLAMFFARLPCIFICRKRASNNDNRPLLSQHHKDGRKTCIERGRFSREDTIVIMFCGATKTVAKGLPLISAVNSAHNQELIGLLALPSNLYHVELLIIGAVKVVLLQYWLKSNHDNTSEELVLE